MKAHWMYDIRDNKNNVNAITDKLIVDSKTIAALTPLDNGIYRLSIPSIPSSICANVVEKQFDIRLLKSYTKIYDIIEIKAHHASKFYDSVATSISEKNTNVLWASTKTQNAKSFDEYADVRSGIVSLFAFGYEIARIIQKDNEWILKMFSPLTMMPENVFSAVIGHKDDVLNNNYPKELFAKAENLVRIETEGMCLYYQELEKLMHKAANLKKNDRLTPVSTEEDTE